MIAKKVPNPKKSGSKSERAGGLVDYITAPEREDGVEKCLHCEAVNFMTDTLAAQKLEMIALSQEGVKSKDPIDHWVLSWRHDEHPTPAQARQAVAIFIDHCGLSGHQYVWGLHDDTQNKHVHIAVNRVHPDTLRVTKINKGFDREASQQAIALIEHAQGWQQEAGARYAIAHGNLVKRTQDPAKVLAPSTRAQDMERQTGEKSAERIGIENAAPLIKNAHSWQELHAQLAAHGMRYARKGSGAMVHVGDVALKASTVDRAASLSALQKRFGPYQPPQEITPNDYHHHTPQPYPAALRENAGHGLRHLSACRLAHSEKGKHTCRAGVLHLDARADRPGTGGLRRDTGRDRSAGLAPQPLRPGQQGWKEYIALRDTQQNHKTLATTALSQQHGAARTQLFGQQKAERDAVLAGSWKGRGDLRNAMQSVLATQQAAAKLALSAQQRAERKTLQAHYKPLPMYKQWKEQPLIVSEHVRPLVDQRITRERQPPALSTLLTSLSHTIDQRGHVTYRQNGRDLFRDEGRTIQILDVTSDAGIAAALATAQQKYGNTLTLTGSPAFLQNAVAVAVANNLTCKFADPALDAMRARLTAEKYQAERTAARAAERVPPTKAPPFTPEQIDARARFAAEAVKADARAALTAELQGQGKEVRQVEDGLSYAGKIMTITEDGRFAVQKVDRNAVVIHDLVQLEGSYTSGQDAVIQYRQGRGQDKLQGQQRGHPDLGR